MPVRDAEKRPVQNHYPSLATIRHPLSIRVKSRESILADKLVAFSSSLEHTSPRWRDLWYVNWLAAQGTQVHSDLVVQRAADFRIPDVATEIDTAAHRIPGLVDSPGFREQLSRFLDEETAARTVHGPAWREQAGKQIQSTFQSFQPVSTDDLKREDQSNIRDDTHQASKSKAGASNRKTDNGNDSSDPF